MGKSNEIAVICILGQAQNLMLPALLERHDHKNTIILSTYPVSVYFSGMVVNIKPSSSLGFIKLWFKLFFVFFKLRSVRKIYFYTPHILNFVANKIYFSFHEKIDFYYLFDGILNYRSVPANSGRLKAYQKKQAYKSILIFHKYVWLMGEVVDQSLPGLKGFIIPDAALEAALNSSLPVFKVGISKRAYLPESKILLLPPVLQGHELENFKVKLKGLLISKYLDCSILVKPHPSQAAEDFKILLSELESSGLRVEMISSDSPAEDVFVERKCRAVISSTSSALLLIKGMYPEADVYSVLGEVERADTEMRRILMLFVESGVILI